MRLIDADALKEQVCLDGDCTQCKTGVNEKLCKWNMVQLNDVMKCLEDAPTIDAVPVVRCKDCKRCHRFADDSNSNMKSWCLKFSLSKRVNDNDFCAWGEREDND